MTMKTISLLTAATIAFAGLSLAPKADAQQVIKIDGSSTVFPITEAVAEEFQISQARQGPRDGRHLRHGRRLQEVLPRRDRHPGRLAPDPEGGDGSLPRGRHQVHRAADRLRRADGRREPAEHLGDAADGRRAQEDVGAGRPGQDHDAGTRSTPSGRTSRSSCSGRAPTPAPSTTSPRRSSARPSRAAATSPPARTTTCSCRASPATRARSATSATPTTSRTQTS